MTSEMDSRLKQLIALWTDGDSASLLGIPSLCGEIAALAADGGIKSFDQGLMDRAERLSARAERRLAACLEILSRTGEYSTQGQMGLSPRVVTVGWEG